MNAYPQFYDIVKHRYSCRGYDTTRPVSADALTAVFDTARLAPSAVNRQPWLFIVAATEAERQAICEAYPREWIKTAPVLVVACGLHDEALHRAADGKDHTDIDVAIATEHVCLAATSLGLATCLVCNFDTALIRRAFALPDTMEPVAIIPLGYPAEGASERHPLRKGIDEILRYGGF